MENFSQILIQSIDEKAAWYDSDGLPAALENYRLLHTCVRNILEALAKKSLITPDPYKTEKKISDITTPDSTPFTDQEKLVTMGIRTSDYESTMDFLCNYYKFSVSNLTITNIRKLVDLNNWIQWTSLTPNNPKIITRTFANMIFNLRQSADPITASMITDSLSKASRAMSEINKTLKEFTDFQKEMYKANIRRNVFTNPSYNAAKAAESAGEEITQIKKNFTSSMGKIPFYNELIDEIIHEDHDPDKDALQKKVLDKLQIQKAQKETKEVKVDTKEMLMSAVRVLGAMPPQLAAVITKIKENHELIESEHNSFMDKLKRAIRKAFSLPEKPVIYKIVIVEQSTESKRHENLNYQNYMAEMEARYRRYSACSAKGNPGYDKLFSLDEEKILDFINKQIIECNKMLVILTALDNFFKAAVLPQNRNRVKGIKIEITGLKNCIVKTNQHRAEYSAYIEEEEQMKKLGIKL